MQRLDEEKQVTCVQQSHTHTHTSTSHDGDVITGVTSLPLQLKIHSWVYQRPSCVNKTFFTPDPLAADLAVCVMFMRRASVHGEVVCIVPKCNNCIVHMFPDIIFINMQMIMCRPPLGGGGSSSIAPPSGILSTKSAL